MFRTLTLIVLFAIPIALPAIAKQEPSTPSLLDPETIPKYVNQIEGPPPVYAPREIRGKGGEVVRHEYTVLMQSFTQQILPPGYPTTEVWGYGGVAKDALTGKPLGFVRNSPGPTFEAVRNITVYVDWQNRIWSSHMFPVDPTLHWANPNNMIEPEPADLEPWFEPYPPGYPEAQWPVPLIPHLHGGEVQSTSDGHPEAWFTINGIQGPAYNTARNAKGGNTAVFVYPNEQPPTTLWYHDHALGITRLNVMSGLAGFYLLRDPYEDVAEDLPSGEYEMP
ncbi:MAG: multicopper oxidase domain-containing protein, partial [Candidatus Bathyarchaeota archaeon]